MLVIVLQTLGLFLCIYTCTYNNVRTCLPTYLSVIAPWALVTDVCNRAGPVNVKIPSPTDSDK